MFLARFFAEGLLELKTLPDNMYIYIYIYIYIYGKMETNEMGRACSAYGGG